MNVANKYWVVGSDPEMMLTDAEGVLISAIGLVPGTKEDPEKVAGGAIQCDNVLCEVNTDPAGSDDEFVEKLGQVILAAAKIVSPLRLVVQAGADYPSKALEHKDACRFGCDPDYNAWPNQYGMVDINIVPSHAAALPFRSAGGHLHVGYTKASEAMLTDDMGRITTVQMLDVFCGLFGAAVDDDPTSVARRSLYGKSGAHRPKPYGVEYRAMGNFWIRSPQLVKAVYTMADVAVMAALKHKDEAVIKFAGGAANIQKVVNGNDSAAAKKILLETKLASMLPNPIKDLLNSTNPMAQLAPLPFYESWNVQI